MMSADSTNKIDSIKQINSAIKHGDYREADALVDQLCKAQGFDTEYPMPDSFISELKEKEHNMRKHSTKHKWQKKVAIWAVVIAALGAGGFTTRAVVKDMVKQRMEAMPEEKKEDLLKILDSVPTNAIYESRELTAAEEKRRLALTNEYVKGKFPENEITMVRADNIEDLNNLDKDTLYYVYNRARIYYPERELTDEEHLQVIDLFKKQEYVIQERYERDYKDEIEAAEAEQQKASEESNITEEKAIAIADEFRNKVLGESGREITEELKQKLISRGIAEEALAEGDTELIVDIVFCEATGDSEEDPTYLINYNTNTMALYAFVINAQDGTVEDMFITFDSGMEELSTSAAEESVPALYEKAKEDLKIQFGISEEYTETHYSYFTNTDSETIHFNELSFLFVKEDGTGYRLTYNCNAKELSRYSVIKNFDDFLQQQADNESTNNKTFIMKDMK
ncbi:MAG: hypothetical protein K2J90_06645 [Lachnospiraceae bacterium]|nr:hypothetical protein [Lachnospiraceae bacterium]